MRKIFVLAVALLLTAGLAAADTLDTTTPTPAPTLDDLFAADEGANCQLPDFSGLSEEEIAELAIDAGFGVEPVQAQPPVCPTSFQCNSITNCAAGPNCSVTDIGPCCSQGGITLCCIQGTIKVQRCPCVCTAFLCNIQCPASTNVRWRCS